MPANEEKINSKDEETGESEREIDSLLDEPADNTIRPQTLTKGQKMATGFLSIFAVIVVILWSTQFKNSINQPFNSQDNNNNSVSQTSSCPDGKCQEADSEASLRNKDTDSDGLNDWDEMNVYRTSPYLEDSDSDGFTDKQEIDTKNDPLCPTGRDCSTANPLLKDEAENKTNNNAALPADNGAALPANNQNSTPAGSNADKVLGGQGDAAALRKYLLDSGVSKELLDSSSDAELMAAYQEIFNSKK